MAGGVDDLEEVPVDGFAEEEALEWDGAELLEELAAGREDALAQGGEVAERVEESDVATELGFERGDGESCDVQNVQLLAVADVEPEGFDRGVVRARLAPVPERFFQKARGGFYVLCGKR